MAIKQGSFDDSFRQMCRSSPESGNAYRVLEKYNLIANFENRYVQNNIGLKETCTCSTKI
jgi:hypothetical protein